MFCAGDSLPTGTCQGLCQCLAVEQLGSCMLHLVVSGSGGALGKTRDLFSACSCFLLQVQVRQEIPGPLDGLAPLGRKDQAKLCLRELLVWEASAHGGAVLWACLAISGLSCCSLTREFAILSFVAVPQKC